MNNNYLMHHGVKGMKWGVRHDPVLVGRRRGRQNIPNKNRRKINAKKLAKRGAIVAGVILAGAAGAYLIKSGKAQSLVNLGKGFLKNNLNGKFTKELDLESIKKMNPTGNTENCAFTSAGYIVNQITGKNVTANAHAPDLIPGMTGVGGTKSAFFDSIFDGLQRTKTATNPKSFSDLPTMSNACKNIKNDSRGIMFVHNDQGLGHYVNYEKTKNGALRIIDCQSNSTTGRAIDTAANWDRANIRPSEIIDCTNAKLAEGADSYLNKILKGV